jgi:type II secretory pathway component GspD/PulD (secretin)
MKTRNILILAAGLLVGPGQAWSQDAGGGANGLVDPPAPITTNFSAKLPMKPLNTGTVSKPSATVGTANQARTAPVVSSTTTTSVAVPTRAPANSARNSPSAPAVSQPVPVAVPVLAAPTPAGSNVGRPTAMPVQPVIPGFDPMPFLEAEQSVMEGLTNTAPEDEIILELKYDDIELIDLIKSLSLQADLNILFDPTLVNQVDPTSGAPLPQPIVPAFRMSNVTAKQALEAILDNYNFQMVHDPKTNTYRITNKSAQAKPPTFTRIITLKYTNPTNLTEVITAVVQDGGAVTPYARTQQLIITATEDQWEMVNQLLDQLDTPAKQVLIEANILETSQNPSSIKGIDWSGTLQAQNFGFGNGSVSGTVTQTRPGAATTTTQTLPSGRTVTTTGQGNSTLAETITSTVGGVVPGVSLNTRDGFFPAAGYLNADGVRGVLSYLNADSETEVIATPRAVMMDGDTASLAVTRAFPIFEITPGSANSPAGASISYTNMGTILEVTPTVQANDHVLLHVIPEVSNIDGQDTQTINGTINQANIYAIRRIETHVMVPSGHTLVMGGLINDTKTKGQTKVPLFGDIPGLGWAFRRESNQQRKQNLLIFITPTIIETQHFQAPQTDFLHGSNQQTADDFLRQGVPERREEKTHFMDSAQPYDYKKGKKKKSSWFKWGGNK